MVKLSKLQLEGRNTKGSMEVDSAWVLKAVSTIHRKGTSMVMENTIRNRWISACVRFFLA